MLISICLWLNGKSDRNQFNMALVVGGGGGGIYISISYPKIDLLN